jgi:HNH endonuclease
MKPRESALSFARLCEVVDYDPNTGIFRWKMRTSNRVAVGDICGQVDRHGHRSINIDGWRYLAHRLAWFYMYAVWPKEEIDHINQVTDDNRIENLREVSRSQNNMNRSKNKSNAVGFKGVCRHPQAKHKFMAQITVNRKNIYLGLYDTPEEAHAKYVEASKLYHGEYGRTT